MGTSKAPEGKDTVEESRKENAFTRNQKRQDSHHPEECCGSCGGQKQNPGQIKK